MSLLPMGNNDTTGGLLGGGFGGGLMNRMLPSDPRQQAWNQAAFALLATPGNIAQKIGGAGLAGLSGYQSAQQNQLLQKYREMQMQQMQSEMDERRKAQEQKAKIEEIAKQSYGAIPVLPTDGDYQNSFDTGGAAPPTRGFGMNQEQFIDRLSREVSPLVAQQYMPKTDYKVVGNNLVGIGPDGVKPVYEAPVKETPPSAIREYEYARQQGYKGSFNDWELSRRRAGATNVSLDARNYSTQENEQSKAYGKTLGEIRSTISNAAFKAPSTMAKLNRIEELLQGVDGGRLAPVGLEVSSAANSLGLKVDPNLGNKQAAEALARELAGELREPGTGPMTDKDFENFLQQVPNLSKTAEGRAQIIETSRRKLARDVEIGKLAREYARRNGGVVDDGFLDVVSDYVAQNPVIPRQSTSGRANVFPDMNAIEAELARRKGQR